MIIKLHEGVKRKGSDNSEILIQAERISMVREKYYMDFTTGGTPSWFRNHNVLP